MNRFLEMDAYLKEVSGKTCRGGAVKTGTRSATMSTYGVTRVRSVWSRPFAATDRTLVILIENGGVDLGIPDVVDKVLSNVPGASILPDSVKQDLVEFLRNKIKSLTDQLLESAELYINRFSAAKPDLFSDVVILRDGTSSYSDLKSQLLGLSKAGKIIDLFVLTHGSGDFISVPGGVDSAKIRALKTENGGALSIRAVYMMNCVGSSLNQAWLDAGARVSSGALKNNYLPEPSMYFFWRAWQDGQTFEAAVTSAYRKTINMMNDAVRGFISALPFPGTTALANLIDFADFEFVKDSAPVISGQRTLTINSDNLSSSQSVSASLATTVLPMSVIRQLSTGQPGLPLPGAPAMASRQAIEFLKGQEQFHANAYNDPAGNCAVGYGTRLHDGKCDGRPAEQPYAGGISEREAAVLLEQRAGEVQKAINECVIGGLNNNQNDALVSFVYSIGIEAFKGSTLLKLLNEGNYDGAAQEMKKWVRVRKNGDTVEVPELVKRREAETELFRRVTSVLAQSMSRMQVRNSSKYESPGYYAIQQARYAYQMNPAAVGAAISIADAAQIGLGAVSVVQSQVAASQGAFTLTYDKAQRLLSTEARVKMPGAAATKSRYERQLLYVGIGRLNAAEAQVIIEWEGNAYGEISTPIIRKDLKNSTDWSKSSATIAITKRDVIPPSNSDPREWPIVYHYDGSYDPWGNGMFEFTGDFEITAFGGIKFTKHEVVSRSLADWAIAGSPDDYVVKGADVAIATPQLPADQLEYLKTRLP